MVDAFFIVGPTAVGKTGLAVDLAERCGAEIVSADAFQIYQGFDLLTAKPTSEEQRRVVHHLVGSVSASESYNVARYLEEATTSIAEAHMGGKPVLVVGGNGLYVKALTHGLSPLPPANLVLRAELETLLLPELLSRLQTLDPVTYATIDRANGRRLVRALEVCLLTGKPFSSFRSEWQPTHTACSFAGVFLLRDREDLSCRIEQRVGAMFTGGVLEEVRTGSQASLSPTASQILGLKDIQEHLSGHIGFRTCQERITIATRQYAKRQVTWFKRETLFEGINLSPLDTTQQREHLQECFQRWRASRPSSTKVLDDRRQMS